MYTYVMGTDHENECEFSSWEDCQNALKSERLAYVYRVIRMNGQELCEDMGAYSYGEFLRR